METEEQVQLREVMRAQNEQILLLTTEKEELQAKLSAAEARLA